MLREAFRTAGLDPAGAELLRIGSNAVYRLDASPVRIARDRDSLPEMERAVRVARWLAAEDFPANRVLPDLKQPLVLGGRVVTYWESAQEREEYAGLNELADLLRRLHWLEEPRSLGLPYFAPFPKLRAALAELDGAIPADDWTFLEERVSRLYKDYDMILEQLKRRRTGVETRGAVRPALRHSVKRERAVRQVTWRGTRRLVVR